MHRSSVTNAVEKLVGAGLVERVPHPTDGRATLARITDAGRETAQRATEVLNADQFGVGMLSASEQDELFAILRSVRANARDFG